MGVRLKRLRGFLAVVIVCGLAAPTASSWARTGVDWRRWARLRADQRVSPDEETDRAYRALVAVLPERGSVGVHVVVSGDDGRTRFRLQYALAPRRLLDSIDTPFVVEVGADTSSESLVRNAQFLVVAAPTPDLRVFRRTSQ